MVTHTASDVITATTAAEFAQITYRQLDHWATKKWVTPSIESGGHGRRRLYSIEDVLRMAALRHFARSGFLVAELGADISGHELAGFAWLVAGTESGLIAVRNEAELLEVLDNPERFSVYHLNSLRHRITRTLEPTTTTTPVAGVASLRRPA